MLDNYQKLYPQPNDEYNQDHIYSQAVSQTITQILSNRSRLKLGEIQCFSFIKQCLRVNKINKDCKLEIIFKQIKSLQKNDPIYNTHLVVRGYMQNMVIGQLLRDLNIDQLQTSEYYEPDAFMMQKECRKTFRSFLSMLQEKAFLIQVQPAEFDISLNFLRIQVQGKQNKANTEIQQDPTQLKPNENNENYHQVQNDAANIDLSEYLGQSEVNTVSLSIKTNNDDENAIKEINKQVIHEEAERSICVENLGVHSSANIDSNIEINSKSIEKQVTRDSDNMQLIQELNEQSKMLNDNFENQIKNVTVQENNEEQNMMIENQSGQISKPPKDSDNEQQGELTEQQEAQQEESGSESSEPVTLIQSAKHEEVTSSKQPNSPPVQQEAFACEESSDGALVITRPELLQKAQEQDIPKQINTMEQLETILKRSNFGVNLSLLVPKNGSTIALQQMNMIKNSNNVKQLYAPIYLYQKQVLDQHETQMYCEQIIPQLMTYGQPTQKCSNQVKQIESANNKKHMAKPMDHIQIQGQKMIDQLKNVIPFFTAAQGEYMFNFVNSTFASPYIVSEISYQFYVPDTNVEKQIALQDNVCAGCQQEFGMNESVWFCQYSGKFFCRNCPSSAARLPGAIRQRVYSPVLMSAKYFEKVVQDLNAPHILTECLPIHIQNDRMFKRALHLRRQLLQTYFILRRCPDIDTRLSREFFTQFRCKLSCSCGQFSIQQQDCEVHSIKLGENQSEFGPNRLLGPSREHIGALEQAVLVQKGENVGVLSVGYWSFRDLFELQEDYFGELIAGVLKTLGAHIMQCQRCRKAAACVCVCFEDAYAFQRDVTVCWRCGQATHQKCCARCPRCGGDEEVLRKRK